MVKLILVLVGVLWLCCICFEVREKIKRDREKERMMKGGFNDK